MNNGPAELSDSERSTLRKRENVGEKADITFRACPVCAYAEWSQTLHDGTGKTELYLGDSLCQACAEYRYRNPETFAFIFASMRGGQIIQHYFGKREE